MLTSISWVEIIMCEIQDECVFIVFAMILFVIMWNFGWMVNVLNCHHDGEGLNSFMWHPI